MLHQDLNDHTTVIKQTPSNPESFASLRKQAYLSDLRFDLVGMSLAREDEGTNRLPGYQDRLANHSTEGDPLETFCG